MSPESMHLGASLETLGEVSDERIPVRDDVDLVLVRRGVREQGRRLGFSHAQVEALATAATEVARNMVVHAEGGEVAVGPCWCEEQVGIRVVARDRGPGIFDVQRALEDGVSTCPDGLGLGLSSAKRLADDFELESKSGVGTTVTLRKWKQ